MAFATRSCVGAVFLAVLLVATKTGACTVDHECFIGEPGDPCRPAAFCVGGVCQYGYPDCEDGNPCTVNMCVPHVGCVTEPLCPSDAFVCNGVEHCFAPVGLPPTCLPGTPLDCDDGDACTTDDQCTEPGGCSYGVKDCRDDDPCTADGCDSATGCTHEPIPDCCRDAGDCPSDACTIPECVAATCTGAPLSCDDGNPTTMDSCNPATGCSNTLPPECGLDAECPADSEPCTVEACDGGRCESRPVEGFDAVACTCRRALPPSCAGETLPAAVTKRSGRACVLIERAANAKRAPKLLRRAGRLLSKARKRLVDSDATSQGCRDDMDHRLADAATRAGG
jgi:hypothetical protein